MSGTETARLDRFCETYLESWDARSTVRAMQRVRPDANPAGVDIIPDFFVLSLLQPELSDLKPDVRDYILTQKAYWFLESLARHETDTVTAISIEIANGKNSVGFSKLARQTMMTVAIDEPYHAFTAREFLNSLVEAKGIKPLAACIPEVDRHHIAFLEVQRRVPEELRSDYRLIAVCLLENLITDEVIDFSRTSAKDSPINAINREHMIDEGRHAEYFRRVLRYYWQGLDSDVKRVLAPFIAELIHELGKMDDWFDLDERLLIAAGIDRTLAADLKLRSIEQFKTLPSMTVNNTCRALERAGLVDDPRVASVLEEHGWIEGGTSV